jgi:hypothetical protein
MSETAEKAVPAVSKGKRKFPDIDWETITWPEFRAKYPDVSKANYYNYRADNKPASPSETHVPTVAPDTSLIELNEKQKAICERISKGETESHAVESEGVSIQQHMYWMNQKDGAIYAKMVKECLKFAQKRIKDSLVDNIIKFKDRAWQASAWYLERMYPAEFARPEAGGKAPSVAVNLSINVRNRPGKDITSSCTVQTAQTEEPLE